MSKWPSLEKIKMIDDPLTDEDYERRLKKLQNQLLDLQIHHLRTGGRAIIGIDGWDAAGKGGLIQRMVFGLEPRSVQVWRIGAPTPEEQGKHFLWRFWDRVPAPRNWAIFDRTWYGRVLVERIEGFCSKSEWQRAYDEINQFEKTLADSGVRFVKLLVHVSEEEQKKRMIERLEKPHKRYKVGPEDFRNIAKRKQYLEAYKDMLDKTDTDHAPWHVIATDDKRHERLIGLQIVVDELGRGVEIAPQELDPEVAAAAFTLWGWKPPKKDEK